MLFRAGGYWWDGQDWFRPFQIYDAVNGCYAQRRVRSATTITAAQTLADEPGNPSAGTIHAIGVGFATLPPSGWADDLAAWALRRTEGDALPLDRCVIGISAPELAGDRLLGTAELAELAGIAAGTLRAYITRGEAYVPEPQAVISSRSAWSKPVAEDWVEARHRSDEAVAATIPIEDPGLVDVRDALTTKFESCFSSPERRSNFVLKRRNSEDLHAISGDLATIAARNLQELLPALAIATTVVRALVQDLARTPIETSLWLGIDSRVGVMLDWLIRHDPNSARSVINSVMSRAREQHDTPHALTLRSIGQALALDGRLPASATTISSSVSRHRNLTDSRHSSTVVSTHHHTRKFHFPFVSSVVVGPRECRQVAGGPAYRNRAQLMRDR